MQKKKRKLKVKNISILMFLIIVIILVIIFKFPKTQNLNQSKDINDNIKRDNLEQSEKKEYSISMVMVGDALINDYLYKDAATISKDEKYDFKPYITKIKNKIKDYDIAYYNQETILGGTSIGLSSYPAFNSPQEVGDAMIDAGFNLVSLATNHTLDRGIEAVTKSREYWNKQKNIQAVGSYTSNEEKKEIESKILEQNNIKYAILNYTYGTNGIPVPENKNYLVNLWKVDSMYNEYKEIVKKDIEQLRDKVDVLIVAMHWGVEYTHTPTQYEKDMAAFLADNGVDIVIGTHPHVIQPVEWIDDTIVFYSLGNFISSQTSNSCSNNKCNIGLMSTLKITKIEENDKTNVKIDNIENELIYTYNQNYHNYLVIPFSDHDIAKYLNNYQNVYTEYSKIISNEDSRIKTVELAT